MPTVYGSKMLLKHVLPNLKEYRPWCPFSMQGFLLGNLDGPNQESHGLYVGALYPKDLGVFELGSCSRLWGQADK